MKKVLTLLADCRTDLSYCCGVDEIGEFHLVDKIYEHEYGNILEDMYPSGTGMMIATFNSKQKKQLEAFRKTRHTILFESPWKRNSNSGNRVKLFVLQYKKPKNSKKES